MTQPTTEPVNKLGFCPAVRAGYEPQRDGLVSGSASSRCPITGQFVGHTNGHDWGDDTSHLPGDPERGFAPFEELYAYDPNLSAGLDSDEVVVDVAPAVEDPWDGETVVSSADGGDRESITNWLSREYPDYFKPNESNEIRLDLDEECPAPGETNRPFDMRKHIRPCSPNRSAKSAKRRNGDRGLSASARKAQRVTYQWGTYPIPGHIA